MYGCVDFTHHTTSTPPSPFYMEDGLTSLASISVSFDPSSAHTPNPAPHCFYPVFLGLRGAIAGGVDTQVRAAGASSSILLCLVSDVLHPSSHRLSQCWRHGVILNCSSPAGPPPPLSITNDRTTTITCKLYPLDAPS